MREGILAPAARIPPAAAEQGSSTLTVGQAFLSLMAPGPGGTQNYIDKVCNRGWLVSGDLPDKRPSMGGDAPLAGFGEAWVHVRTNGQSHQACCRVRLRTGASAAGSFNPRAWRFFLDGSRAVG